MPEASQLLGRTLHWLTPKVIHGPRLQSPKEVSQPNGSQLHSLTCPGHWVFAPDIQSVLYQKNIPFHIRATDNMANKSLQRATGQVVPVVQYNSLMNSMYSHQGRSQG